MFDEGHHCLGQDPGLLTLCLFLQGIPADSQDFPSIVNSLQGFSLAAKQEFTPAKSTWDQSTEGIKVDSSQGVGMEHRSRKLERRCSGRWQGRG